MIYNYCRRGDTGVVESRPSWGVRSGDEIRLHLVTCRVQKKAGDGVLSYKQRSTLSVFILRLLAKTCRIIHKHSSKTLALRACRAQISELLRFVCVCVCSHAIHTLGARLLLLSGDVGDGARISQDSMAGRRPTRNMSS